MDSFDLNKFAIRLFDVDVRWDIEQQQPATVLCASECGNMPSGHITVVKCKQRMIKDGTLSKIFIKY